MRGRITLFDYDADWALKDRNVEPRPTPGYLTREEVIQFYGTLGLDGVELRDEYWYDYSPANLKRLTADAGLPIVSYIFVTDLAAPVNERRSAIDSARRLLNRTAELGASFAMILPALVKDSVPLAQQRAWLVEGLRQCAEIAQSLGITLAVENLDWEPMRPFIGRGADCRDLCAAVDSPAFRLIYDVAAPIFNEEDPLETLREMSKYLVHTHLKNIRPVGSGEVRDRYRDSIGASRYTGTVLSEGMIKIQSVLAELERMGYDGYLMIEYQGEDDPRSALPHNVSYLRRLVRNLS